MENGVVQGDANTLVQPKKKSKWLVILIKINRVMSISLVSIIAYMYFESKFNAPAPAESPARLASVLPSAIEKPQVSDVKPEKLKSYIASWKNGSSHQLVQAPVIEQAEIVESVVFIPSIRAYNSKVEVLDNKEAVINKVASSNIRKIQAKKIVKKKNSVIAKVVGRYTIQLLASHKKSDVDLFRKNNKLLDKTKVRHITNEKGSWYVLTWGEYVNRQQARVGMGKLSYALTKLNPWIRTVPGIEHLG